METSFRQSMHGLHTWAGVICGTLLFAVFWMGTLAVFDKEIDLWMSPMIRVNNVPGGVSLDAQKSSYAAAVAERAPTWNIVLPNDRIPVVRAVWFGAKGPVFRYNAPFSGEELPDAGTLGGSGFIYPFHYTLQLRFMNLGIWLVGLASMAMLALCVSGVVIHRKIFADFFTFRPGRNLRRATLDLHNVAGVLGLPFHFGITLSGVVILYMLYMPSGWISVYGATNLRTFTREAFQTFSRPRVNMPGELASLDTMADQVRKLWPDAKLASVSVYNPGDAAAYVEFNTSTSHRVALVGNLAIFDAKSGELLFQRTALAPVMTGFRFMFGMHIIQFQHWTLRWLYFVLGLTGCVLIATGTLFWLASRRKASTASRFSGFRVVESLAVSGVSGIILATCAFFAANRILPLDVAGRATIELWIFYMVWLASFVHAWLRAGRPAWREQAWMIAVTAVLALMLNAVTTGDHLLRSLSHPYLWPVAGMDLALLGTAFVAIVAANRLRDANLAGAGESDGAGKV